MDQLLHRYHSLDDKRNSAALLQADNSIRSVIQFLKEEEHCTPSNFLSCAEQITTKADSPSVSPLDSPNSTLTRSTCSRLSKHTADSASLSPIMTAPARVSFNPQTNPGFSSQSREEHSINNRTLQNSGSDWNQAEYFCDDRSGYLSGVQPSPISDIATPPMNIGQSDMTTAPPVLSLPASAASLSPASVSTNGSMLTKEQPQLYSAIGSLENPSANSLSRWNHTRQTNKYDFPSNTLLKPMNTIKHGKNNAEAGHGAGAFPKVTLRTPRKIETTESIHPPGDSSSRREGETTDEIAVKKPSNLKKSKVTNSEENKLKSAKHVTISEQVTGPGKKSRSKKKGPLELFRPSSDAYTPRMGKKEIKYKPAEMRTPVQTLATSLGTLQRPNFRDALRRVAMILHQHIVKIEQRFENKLGQSNADKLFDDEMKDLFSEHRFASSRYKCTMVRVPMARGGMVYGLKQIRQKFSIPTESEIYEFAHQLFNTVQLSSECSIVCLIYVERLMETSKVPLLASTWRPIFMCGLLLASKVWQDLSSWNIEFASVYPQFSLDSINRLEILFLRMIKWDLYISSSCYAKYYFALRSLVEKPDFRQRYNRMVGLDSVQASEALKIERRSTMVKEEAISQLSRSM